MFFRQNDRSFHIGVMTVKVSVISLRAFLENPQCPALQVVTKTRQISWTGPAIFLNSVCGAAAA
jgi:hypothetical protein